MTRSVLPALLLLLTGCALQAPQPFAAPPAAPAPPEGGGPAPKGDGKLQQARLELEANRQAAALAEAELAAQELEGQASVARARKDLELATARQAQYRDAESVRKLQESALEVQRSRDQIDDAREELAQLEKLYQGNDLADSTKEIVLKRGRRGLERSATALALKELEAKALKECLIPLELARLQLEVDQKQGELDRATRGAALQLRQKRLGLARAQVEIQKSVNALDELGKK